MRPGDVGRCSETAPKIHTVALGVLAGSRETSLSRFLDGLEP